MFVDLVEVEWRRRDSNRVVRGGLVKESGNGMIPCRSMAW
jgi:hypothetical protein